MRRAALLATVVAGAVLIAPASAAAAGGTYVVVQCHELNRGAADAVVTEPRPYGVGKACSDAARDNAIEINSRLSALPGREGSVRWIAPEHTAFVRVRAETKLRRDAGHYARLLMADGGGRETHRIASATPDPTGFDLATWSGDREEQLVAVLGCGNPDGCPQSDQAKTYIRAVKMTLADYADPTVAVSGSLVSGGWKRGIEGLEFGGADEGAGLADLVIAVNGIGLARTPGECPGSVPGGALASRTRPCTDGVLAGLRDFDTSATPFRDGGNELTACVVDFADNRSCTTHRVDVDNSGPELSFTNAQDPDDPELIHAPVSDRDSGVRTGQIYYRADGAALWQPIPTQIVGGELQARVDSTAVPAGPYEFMAVAQDVAGNETQTTRRLDGLEMQLDFPLKAGVRLDAGLEPGGAKRLTRPYGRPSRVTGRLRGAAGEPIAGGEIVVTEFFGEGALLRERISRVTTDEYGRWKSRLPAGPSRRVTAYYAGTKRYLPESTLGGRLQVRSKASLRISKRRIPEGDKVIFRGRVGRLGARIPRGGKLLELQVKQDGGGFQTVGQGFRSKPSGRYRLGYRFGRFYQYDVRFKFRLKVAREGDWPYKAPVRSRARTVTVLAR